MSATFDLDVFERWMLTVVAHRDGLDAGLEAGRAESGIALDSVLPSKNVTALDRMRIYSDMYYWRLVDILRGDFPGLRNALAEQNDAVFRDYLAAHPSTNPRLTPLGRHLSDFLRARTDLVASAFLADLAALEFAREVVFEQKRSAVLAPDALTQLPPHQWAEARLERVAASALLASEYPVNDYLDAVHDHLHPSIPEASQSYALLCRGADLRVYRRTLSLAQYAILTTLSEGATLAEALEAGLDQSGLEVDDLLGDLGAWFADWAGLGLFSSIALSEGAEIE